MKRRRKSKKAKAKKPRMAGTSDVAENAVTHNTEDNSGSDEFNNDEFDSGVEVESVSPLVASPPEKPATVDSGVPNNERAGKLVYGRRVKVKIRTSKTLDSQITNSDPPTHSDTDKSSQQVEIEKQASLNEKMEDSANSLSETNTGISGNPSKKSGGIRIKTSRGFGSSSISPCSNAEFAKGETAKLKEPELPKRDNQHNKHELDASLEVIRKVMKMDAAEPFNVPVNPIALGIPDYFDVIDTPMDFGTICGNLESGNKYMNSKDVYKDVQYIWDNCYKYNNKGDYILELMKRVKKNFTKYWTAAGLYSDQAEGTNGGDMIQAKDNMASTPAKMPVKSCSLNIINKKRHGLKKHKDGCLCAICVMMRRRQEREESARMLEDHIEASDDYMDEEGRAEESFPIESPGGEYTSSNMDNSMEQDGGADLEERGGEIKLEYTQRSQEKPKDEHETEITEQEKEEGEICEQSQLGQRSQDQHKRHNQPQNLRSADDVSNKAQRGETTSQQEDEDLAIEQRKAKEMLDRSQRAKMYERLRYLEKSMLFELCGTLFAEKQKSVWTGPHSLVRREDSTRRSSVLDAVTSFMK